MQNPDIKIGVHLNGILVSVVDLAQESEGFWAEFLQEMSNAGHGQETMCRVIAERIKAMVQPVLTQPPGAAIGVNALHDAIDKFFAPGVQKDALIEMVEKLTMDICDAMHAELGRVTQNAAAAEPVNDNAEKTAADAQSAAT